MPDASPVRRSRSFGCALLILLSASLLLNFVLCGVTWYSPAEDDEDSIGEKHLYGPKGERDKIAVIKAEGPLVEGLDAYILKQIEKAGKDDRVKAVVLRVDSPGGTIGSSEEIHRELLRLQSGQHPRHTDFKAKKIVTSMGSIAASGGYYISMPTERIFAEKGCLTGSIGVYASLPNVSEFAHKNGVKMELIKAGGIKGSGSPFHEMTPQERQPWQDMVDQAYDQFLDVVTKGRPKLNKEKLRTEIVDRKQAPVRDDKGNVVKDEKGNPKTVEVTRYRADGGSFTANEALKHELIDEIGLLEDAVKHVAASAGISEYRVVTYQRPATLLTTLLGVKAPDSGLSFGKLSEGFTPRLWYLTPQSELGGIIAIATQPK
jgi:protease-4